MATQNEKVNLYLKKFLTNDQITDNFLDYLHNLIKDAHTKLVSESGIYSYPVTGDSTAIDTVDFLTPGEAVVGDGGGPDLQADDGHGHLLDLSETCRTQVPVPNDIGTTYHCGIRFNWIPQDTEINVRTGIIKWSAMMEAIGELADPNTVSYYANTLQLKVDSICNGVDQVGRTVKVWLQQPQSEASGQVYEDVLITKQTISFQHDGGANYFDIPNELSGYFLPTQTITVDDGDSSAQITTVSSVGLDDSGGTGFTRITTAHDLSAYTVAQAAFVSTGNNIISLVGTLGQSTNPSTTSSDYQVFLKGVTVTTTDLRLNEYYAYLLSYVGTGIGVSPTGFDHSSQVRIDNNFSSSTTILIQFMKDQLEKNGTLIRGGGQVQFESGSLTWDDSFEIFNPYRGVLSIASGTQGSIANNDVLYTEIYERQDATTDGNASGEIYVGDISDFADNDTVIVGDSDSNQITGYVFGAPSSSKITVDDGTGTPIDLSGYTVSKGAWIQKSNLTLSKEVMNQGVLRPDSNQLIDSKYMVLAVRHGDVIIFKDGVLRLEDGDVGQISNLPSGFNWVNNLSELNNSVSKSQDEGVAVIAPRTYTEIAELAFNKSLSWIGLADNTKITGSLATNIIKITPDASISGAFQKVQLKNLNLSNTGAGNVIEIDNVGATKGIVVDIENCILNATSALTIKVTKTVSAQYVKVNINGNNDWSGDITFESNHNDDELNIEGVKFASGDKVTFGMTAQNPSSTMKLKNVELDEVELLGIGQNKVVTSIGSHSVSGSYIAFTNEGVNGLHTDITNQYAIANDTRMKVVAQNTPDKTVNIYPSKKNSDGREIYTFIESEYSSKFPRVSYATGDYDGGANHDQLTVISFSDPSGGVVTVTANGPTFGAQVLGTFTTVGGGSDFTPVGIFINGDDTMSIVAGTNYASQSLASEDDALPLGGGSQFKTACIIHEVNTANDTTQVITISDIIDRRAFGGGGGGGSGDASSSSTRLDTRLNLSPFDAYTPNVASIHEDDRLDGTSTVIYDLLTKNFKFEASGRILLSNQNLDAPFLAKGVDVNTIEVYSIWDLDDIDTGATYEVSRDGGINWETVDANIVGSSDVVRGLHTFIGSKASGTITVINNTFNTGDILTVDGIALTYGTEWSAGASITLSASNIKDAINANCPDVKATSSVGIITIEARVAGPDGNAITLAETDNATDNFTLSGATLSGGHTLPHSIEYDVSNADGGQTLQDTTIESISQEFSVTNATVFEKETLYLEKNGSPLGSYWFKIVADDGGSPSTDLDDIIYESENKLCSDLSSGNNVIEYLSNIVLPVGDYHLVIETDLAYKTEYASSSANNIEVRLDTSSGPTPNIRTYNGTVWSSEVANNSAVYKFEGRDLDARLKITSSDVDKFLKAYGFYYEFQDGIHSTGDVFRELTTFTGDEYEFELDSFLPDSRFLMVFARDSGQVYRFGDFGLQGHKVIFPAGTFDSGSPVTLEFFQICQIAQGASSVADALLSANNLGSTDESIDKSAAGRGLMLRRPDGTLRELTIDNSDNIVIRSV